MAQIRIEEKKNNIIPWIIGLLLLGLIAWAAITFTTDDDDMDDDEATAEMVVTEEDDMEVDKDSYQPAVMKYMEYTQNMEGDMGLDHEFSHNAITYLAAAAEDIGEAYDVDLTDNTQRAEQLASEITKDPMATDHADKIRMAALNITETLERIDTRAMDGENSSAIRNLREQAQAIKAETLTLNQKEDVRTFFGAARTVLENM